MPTMSLDSIKRTSEGKKKPLTVLLYGVEGVGKTTFAADAPGAIFLPVERGSGKLDLMAFPQPEKWEDALAAIDTLKNERHDYRTFVIDTLDRLERVLWEYLCRTNGKKASIEDFGYGKGYILALEHWAKLIARLEELVNERDMNVILLAHSTVKLKKNPGAPDYDRYTLKMQDKAAGLWKEWPDFLLFADHETFTEEKNGKVKAYSAGHRVMYTTHTAAADAKNRAGLKPVLPLDFENFYAEATNDSPERIERMVKQIEDTIVMLPEVDRPKAAAHLAKVKSSPLKLAKFLDFCRSKIATEETHHEESKVQS